MDSEQTDDGEVTEHAVERLGAKLACNLIGILALASSDELFGDPRLLNQRVENVKRTE